MSLAFTKKDLELLLNNSPLVEKKKFIISVEKFAEHPKSIEYILKGKSNEGKEFSFHYAQIPGRPLDESCILNSCRKGFYINTKPKEGDDLIFHVEKPKTEKELLQDKLDTLNVSKGEDAVFALIDEDKLKKLYKKVYLPMKQNKINFFKEYSVELYKAGIAYLVDPDSIHQALIQLEMDIKKFRPSPDYVLSEVLRKKKK